MKAQNHAILLLALLLLLLPLICHSRMLDSTELMVGDWNLSIQCPTRLFQQQLFPLRNTTLSTSLPRNRQQHACRLSVFSNGTFALSPTTLLMDQRLVVRGRWHVHPNPYCVTDRFYDDLILTSFPRTQKLCQKNGMAQPQQKGTWQLQCRLTGHFSPGQWGRRRPWYGQGRLSRGVLVWQSTLPQRSARWCGSFAGQRWIPPLSILHARDDDDPVVTDDDDEDDDEL